MEGGYSSPLRALRRILLYLFLTIPLMPVQAFFLLTNKRLARELPFRYHRRGCRILGIQVVRVGERRRITRSLRRQPRLYFDIPVLGCWFAPPSSRRQRSPVGPSSLARDAAVGVRGQAALANQRAKR